MLALRLLVRLWGEAPFLILEGEGREGGRGEGRERGGGGAIKSMQSCQIAMQSGRTYDNAAPMQLQGVCESPPLGSVRPAG